MKNDGLTPTERVDEVAGGASDGTDRPAATAADLIADVARRPVLPAAAWGAEAARIAVAERMAR